MMIVTITTIIIMMVVITTTHFKCRTLVVSDVTYCVSKKLIHSVRNEILNISRIEFGLFTIHTTQQVCF